jgi:hypothetical protein
MVAQDAQLRQPVGQVHAILEQGMGILALALGILTPAITR